VFLSLVALLAVALQSEAVGDLCFDHDLAARHRHDLAFYQQGLADREPYGAGPIRAQMDEFTGLEDRSIGFTVEGVVNLLDDSFVARLLLIDP